MPRGETQVCAWWAGGDFWSVKSFIPIKTNDQYNFVYREMVIIYYLQYLFKYKK